MTDRERALVQAVATLEAAMLRGADWPERLPAERAVLEASAGFEPEALRDLLEVGRTLADWRIRVRRAA